MTYLLGQTLTETDRLLQVHRLTEIEKIFDGPWVVLYESTRTDSGSATRFCALLADDCLPGASQNWYWDLAIGAGLPGYIESDGKLWYEQPRSNPIEPLIFVRDFPGARPSEIEISEEFRHFHNLCSDHAEGRLIRILSIRETHPQLC